MIQTQIHLSMLCKLTASNTTVSDFMGDFSNLSLYCNEVCAKKKISSMILNLPSSAVLHITSQVLFLFASIS